MHLIQPIPLIWKQKINDSEITAETNHVLQDHYLKRNTSVNVFDKLTARKIYPVLLPSSSNISTSQKYFDKAFPNEHFI